MDVEDTCTPKDEIDSGLCKYCSNERLFYLKGLLLQVSCLDAMGPVTCGGAARIEIKCRESKREMYSLDCEGKSPRDEYTG